MNKIKKLYSDLMYATNIDLIAYCILISPFVIISSIKEIFTKFIEDVELLPFRFECYKIERERLKSHKLYTIPKNYNRFLNISSCLIKIGESCYEVSYGRNDKLIELIKSRKCN